MLYWLRFMFDCTGGTTMSEPFVHDPEWRYRMVFGPRKQANYSLEMTETLQNWEPGTNIFYEYHGGRAAPYMDWSVRDDLQHWRAMAKIRNIPFFAFSVFREPLSFAVSHFNFYYANGKRATRDTTMFRSPPKKISYDWLLPIHNVSFVSTVRLPITKSGSILGNPSIFPPKVVRMFIRHSGMTWIGWVPRKSFPVKPIS